MNNDNVLKFLGFIFKVFAIVNFILMFGDIRLREYTWAIISGSCVIVCYGIAKLIDLTEIK